MNILDERDKRTLYRKIAKKKFDQEITLAVTETGPRVRLLDEGMVVDAAGNPLFYIQKGTLASYYNALPDDYVGSINVGHMDFATFPFILGQWTKKDLHLIDIGDERQALEVVLHLDRNNALVQTLHNAPYDVGVSAEFTYHVNEEASKRLGVEILDAIFIRDFAIVGECGNVNSSGINLKGGLEEMTLKELTTMIDEELVKEEAVEEIIEEEPVKEEAVEEPSEEAEEVKEEVVEEAEEEAEEEEINLSEVIDQLTARIEALETENSELKEKLSVREAEEKEFIEKFKKLNLSVAHSAPKAAPVTTKDYTDGIGE